MILDNTKTKHGNAMQSFEKIEEKTKIADWQTPQTAG